MPSKNKIRVVHIITLLELGGAQQNTLYTVEALDRSRFDVVLVAGAGGYLDSAAKRIPETRVILLDGLVRPVHPVKDLCAYFRLKGLLKDLKRDGLPLLVHTHSSKAGVLGRSAARAAGAEAVIHHVHGLSFPERKGGWFARIGRFLERKVDPWTHGYIAVCHANFRDGDRLGFRVLHPATDTQHVPGPASRGNAKRHAR